MIEYIDAPMPYIIGVPRKIWNEIKKEKDNLPQDIVTFDIDSREIEFLEKSPSFPASLVEQLNDSISSIINEYKAIDYKAKVLCTIQ